MHEYYVDNPTGKSIDITLLCICVYKLYNAMRLLKIEKARKKLI